MGAFGLYLVKSVIWISGFALVYLLFLRNERFFNLNRFFLLTGILFSFLMPLFVIHYTVVLPLPAVSQAEMEVTDSIENMNGIASFDTSSLLILLYLTGIILVGFVMTRQSRIVISSVKKASIIRSSPVKLIRTADYTDSFSFFSFVFINPSVTDVEMEEILNHEMVHVRQKHWIDLVLAGVLCMLQWFNPVVWIYARLIRQNHEYIADEEALQRTSDPAVYRATLLNQIAGFQVVSLANSFNNSLNKKRFEMMKNIITSPYRKMKVLLILPVFAIIFYAFAKPEYRYESGNNTGNGQPAIIQGRSVKGTIIQSENGKPLEKAVVVVTGTSSGTTTDEKGRFTISNIPEGGALAVSYVGYKSKVIKPVFTSDMIIPMDLDTINSEKLINPAAPPPPPPPPPVEKLRTNGQPPLIVLDGKVTDIDLHSIPEESIQLVEVFKDNVAIEKYGEKGRNGVISITTKKHYEEMNKNNPVKEKGEKLVKGAEAGKDIFVVVEELPQFPGGKEAMNSWIYSNMKYPGEAVKNKITGKVYVTFMVTSTGKVKNVEVQKSVNTLLDAEAKRLISSMPDWNPGTQAGKPVDVRYKVPVEFKLQ